MKCLYCNEEFTPLSSNQLYCCSSCGVKYRREHKGESNYPAITFNCSKCGRVVNTDGTSKDRRTRFCSAECEKKWWRHPPHEHETSRTNFPSFGSYFSYEKRTNAEWSGA